MRAAPFLMLLATLSVSAGASLEELLERFQGSRLLAVREHVAALPRLAVQRNDGWLDVRAIFHCHSALSHDSRGTREEIVAAAKEASVQAIFMSEHPRADRDVVREGLQGWHEGVLFIPGIEHLNFLVYPARREMPQATTAEELVARMEQEGGLIFIAHPETFEQWELAWQVDGMEIYNTHSNVKPYIEQGQDILDSGGFAQAMQLLQAFRRFPREAFGMLFDEPAEFLRRFDAQARQGRFSGVAGNDAHSNIGFKLLRVGRGKYEVWDALGERVLQLSGEEWPLLDGLKPKVTEGLIMQWQLDPYERSFGYVSTHLLVKQLGEENLRDAADRGRAYVAFDWMADPTGFRFEARSGETMGEEVWLEEGGVELTAQAPMAARYLLYRDGEPAAESVGSMLRWLVSAPGAYRVEVHLPWLDGGFRPWIYSNPIFVREG